MSKTIDLAEIETLARAAFDALPDHFRTLCGNVVFHVAEEAEPALLQELDIDDPLELSGLFEGVAITDQTPTDPHLFPNHIHLYARALCAEWREREDIKLEALITHVLVHEIGHHFGFSDADMDAIENAVS